jgi:DNA-binding FadR family transcriptional regulator
MLVTKDFQVRLIDHSRSFRPDRELRNPEVLQRFSRTLLDAIGRLDRDGLREAIGRYLSNAEIDRLLQRRDAIVELARQRVAELGEAAVIYP